MDRATHKINVSKLSTKQCSYLMRGIVPIHSCSVLLGRHIELKRRAAKLRHLVQMAQHSTRSSLLALPPELRAKIWRDTFTISSDKVPIVCSPNAASNTSVLRVLQTCKLIYHECLYSRDALSVRNRRSRC